MWPNPDDPREPRWLEEDRAWALALTLEEAEVCGGCGQPLAECMDPRNEFAYQATGWRCHACTAKDAETEKYRDAKPGMFISVRRR